MASTTINITAKGGGAKSTLEVGKNFKMTVLKNCQYDKTGKRTKGDWEGDIDVARTNNPNRQNSYTYPEGEPDGIREGDYTFYLNRTRYNSIIELAKLDGHADDITIEDINNAKSLKGKFGIKEVRVDSAAGKATLRYEGGVEIQLDIESPEEQTTALKLKEKAQKEQQELLKSTIAKPGYTDYIEHEGFIKGTMYWICDTFDIPM